MFVTLYFYMQFVSVQFCHEVLSVWWYSQDIWDTCSKWGQWAVCKVYFKLSNQKGFQSVFLNQSTQKDNWYEINNQILNQILLATHITCWEENNLQIKVLDNKSNKYTSNRSPYIGAYKLIIWSVDHWPLLLVLRTKIHYTWLNLNPSPNGVRKIQDDITSWSYDC